jgi:hypothetical protein
MLKRMTQEQADKFDKGMDLDTSNAVTASAQVGTAPEAASTQNSSVAMPPDRTHLNPYGQKVFGRVVADAIVKTQVELGPDLIGVPGGPTTVQPGGPPGSRPVPVPTQPTTRPSEN